MTACEKISVIHCPLLILYGLFSYTFFSLVKIDLSSYLNVDKRVYDWMMFEVFKLFIN